MGTIKQAESTFGSDFDANNRTMGTSTARQNATIRRDIEPHLQQPIRTEYEGKPWVSKQQSATKDYLRDTAQISVDLNSNFEDQELPSQEQLI